MVVTVLDKSADLPFQVSAQEVVLQEKADLHGLVLSLDFALGLRVMRRKVPNEERGDQETDNPKTPVAAASRRRLNSDRCRT